MNELRIFKQKQQGSTLLEVLGVLFVQDSVCRLWLPRKMKTVMTTVKQKIKHCSSSSRQLIEKYALNPKLKLTTLAGGEKMMYRQFLDYRTLMDLTAACTGDAKLVSAAACWAYQRRVSTSTCVYICEVYQSNTKHLESVLHVCMEEPGASVDKPVLNGL